MNLGLIPAREKNPVDRYDLDVKEARYWAGKANGMRGNYCKMQKALLKRREEIQMLPNPFHVIRSK